MSTPPLPVLRSDRSSPDPQIGVTAQLVERLEFKRRCLLGDIPLDTGDSPPELIGFLQSHPAGAPIDLGCGTGSNAVTMHQQSWKLTGIGLRLRAVRKALTMVAQTGLTPRPC